jgi:hypothetical protein
MNGQSGGGDGGGGDHRALFAERPLQPKGDARLRGTGNPRGGRSAVLPATHQAQTNSSKAWREHAASPAHGLATVRCRTPGNAFGQPIGQRGRRMSAPSCKAPRFAQA